MLLTVGADPLRDEGDEYAKTPEGKPALAGDVPDFFPGQFHGFLYHGQIAAAGQCSAASRNRRLAEGAQLTDRRFRPSLLVHRK